MPSGPAEEWRTEYRIYPSWKLSTNCCHRITDNFLKTDGKFNHLRPCRWRRFPWSYAGSRDLLKLSVAKAGLELPPFLSIAMDLLDAALDDCKLWEDRMQPGEALYCHNLITAHARNAFTDEPGDAPRHKVRIWLKLWSVTASKNSNAVYHD